MEEAKHVATDISAFDKFVNLTNYIGNSQAVKKLQIVLDQHYWNKTQGRSNSKINSIMLIGSNTTTLAKAYSNSFGNLEFFECEACNFGMGQAPCDFFQQGNEFSTYFVKGIEQVPGYSIYGLVRILKDSTLLLPPVPGIRKQQKIKFNRLVILSARELDLINSEVFKYIDVYCYLKPIEKEEIYKILEQKIQILNWSVQSRAILKAIAEACNNDVNIAVQILDWAYRSARANGRDLITTADLYNTLHLLE